MNHTSCQFRDKHTVGGIVFYKHAFLVYRKTGVCRGIPNFFIFDPKHTLWVLGEAVLMCTYNVCFERKCLKDQNFSNEALNFFF